MEAIEQAERTEAGRSYLVPGGIAGDGDILLGASLDMRIWYSKGGGVGGGVRGAGEGEGVLEVEGSFDEGGDKA